MLNTPVVSPVEMVVDPATGGVMSTVISPVEMDAGGMPIMFAMLLLLYVVVELRIAGDQHHYFQKWRTTSAKLQHPGARNDYPCFIRNTELEGFPCSKGIE